MAWHHRSLGLDSFPLSQSEFSSLLGRKRPYFFLFQEGGGFQENRDWALIFLLSLGGARFFCGWGRGVEIFDRGGLFVGVGVGLLGLLRVV